MLVLTKPKRRIETSIARRGPSTRFTPQQIERMTAMARDGAQGPQIAAALGIKAEAIRNKLAKLGISLKAAKPSRNRLRLVLDITPDFHQEAFARGISPSALARRIWGIILRDNLTAAILDDDNQSAAAAGSAAAVSGVVENSTSAPEAAADGGPRPSVAVPISLSQLFAPRLQGCTSVGA
jgi:hypothetical protein